MTRRSPARPVPVALALAATLAVGGCADRDNGPPPPADAPPAVQVGPENVVTVTRETLVRGPIISGELRAQREATVRAELGGAIERLTVDEGQTVRRGAVLGRISASELDEARRSGELSVKAAETQVTLARREAGRTQELVAAGALATRDLDVAESNVAAAEAQLAEASSRLASTRQQIGDAVLRAPIDGVVSNRAVNSGDVVSPGTELFTIIDPSSMRLEASVPAEDLSSLRLGAPVEFRVRGYEQLFEGRIDRISPAVDPATRQVTIFVSIPNAGGRLVSGLYAEGRVVSEAVEGLVVADNAVNTAAETPWVLRVVDGRTERVEVGIGLRDPRTERLQLTSGVAAGDVLLRGPAQGITPGTRVAVGSLTTR